MASPADLAQGLPETLPADFGDWDGEATVNAGRSEGARAFGASPKQPGRESPLAPETDRPRDSRSPLSTPVSANSDAFVRKQKLVSGLMDRDVDAFLQKGRLVNGVVDRLPSPTPRRPEAGSATKPERSLAARAEGSQATKEVQPLAWRWPNVASVGGKRITPEPVATVSDETDAALFESFQSDTEDAGQQKTAKKKWVIAAGVGASAILLFSLAVIPRLNSGAKSAAKPSVQPPPVATETQPDTNTAAPADQTSSAQSKSPTAAETQQTTDSQSPNQTKVAKPTQGQTEMMNDQLSAPTQIPQQVAEDAPPSANLGADGLGASDANASDFIGHSQPAVKVARTTPLVISAGVATGLLIHVSAPIYPAIAKTARVSGTVELDATITKAGAITDLKVVSGPVMLREAALDAVRTWRYKPYRLNNQPVDVQATINVVFSLDK
jgi:TonB family protein